MVASLLSPAKRKAGFLKEEGTSLKEIVNKANTVGRIVDPTTIYKHHVCILSIEHFFNSLFDTIHMQIWAKGHLYDDLRLQGLNSRVWGRRWPTRS